MGALSFAFLNVPTISLSYLKHPSNALMSSQFHGHFDWTGLGTFRLLGRGPLAGQWAPC